MKRLSKQTLPIGISVASLGIIGFMYYSLNKVIVDTCGAECNGSICLDICVPVYGFSPLLWVSAGVILIGLLLIGYSLFSDKRNKSN